MVKINGMKCCVCGTTSSPHWRRYYDSDGNRTEKRTCYECTLKISRENTENVKKRITKKRTCCKCNNSDTYVDSCGRAQWYRYYDDKGQWDRRSYLCYKCKLEKESSDTRKIKELRIRERKCYKCASDKTYIDNSGRRVWFKYRGDNNEREWDRKSWLCNACYQTIIARLPDSHSSAIKLMRNCRDGNINLSKFLSENQKGRIIEDIITIAHGIENYNDVTDSYISPFDAIHPEYGKLQIKGSSFDKKRGIWYFYIGEGQDFDTLIIVYGR